jgi:hypothetical protein
MDAVLETAGERMQIISDIPWVDDLIAKAAPGELRHGDRVDTSVTVSVESKGHAFQSTAWEPLTRGAWRQRDEVVIEDVCSSGFDLHLSCKSGDAEFTFRWRPHLRGRAAELLLRSRFILLARAVLLQYPAMWQASNRGRVPLHASACTVGELRPLLVGPSGVGKSTLMALELESGGSAISDNLCVSDGITAWGLVEPMRVETGRRASMPHGRSEVPLPGRVPSLAPNLLVALRRGHEEAAYLRPCGTATVARTLITGTYMAGELRRYWAFAATLTAGSELGPPHPPVEAVARQLASRLDSVEIVLPRQPGVRLAELLSQMEAIA